MKIKVAILDDHPLVISGLHHVLESSADIEISGSYSDSQKMLNGLTSANTDVLLLDIQLQGQTGDELIEKIRMLSPELKILVLTNFDNVFYIKTMLKKGANGYLLKTSDDDKLVEGDQDCSWG